MHAPYIGRLWATPGAVVGLILAAICLPTKIKIINKNIWIQTRYLIPTWALAQTWGFIVLYDKEAELNKQLINHEHRHVYQWCVFGPFFFILYPLASFYAALRGGHYYFDNAFEIDATRSETLTDGD